MSDALSQFKKELDSIDWIRLISENDKEFDRKWALFLRRASNLGYRAMDLINEKYKQIHDTLFQDNIDDDEI